MGDDLDETANLRPGQRINLPSVPNLRDLGGYRCAGGRSVRWRALYRSTELNRLAGDDLEAFTRLGIRTVADLRTVAEREAQPDVVPEDTKVLVCDVLGDLTSAAPADLLRVVADPALAEDLLGDGKVRPIFEDAYRSIVSLPSALTVYKALFGAIADDADRPLLFHCTTGKDRTGWAAAATLLLLGVADEDVRYDYELTNRDLIPALKPVFEQFRALGGDPKLLEPVLGVDPAYLDAALDEMRTTFGSIEDYFSLGLGIDADGQATLRAALTQAS